MSQARRTSKGAVVPNDSGSTSRAFVSKAVDDSFPRTSSKHEKQRSISRNKIPRKVRYDLENSLIGLCDVWFAEIKPHLVRNNIKLHMPSGDDDKSVESATGCGSGDYDKRQLPGTCSHFDPGAAPHLPRQRNVNYVSFCSMRPTVSRAPCHKPPVLSRLQRQVQLSPTLSDHEYVQNQHHNYNARPVDRPYTIAVHIQSKKHPPVVTSGAGSGRRVTRPFNSIAPVTTAKKLPPMTEENEVRRMCKSSFNKGGVAGLRNKYRSPARHSKNQFSQNK